MKKNTQTNNSILQKLRQPVHISYIAERIVQKDIFETQEIINEFVEDGLVVESEYGKGYYMLKKTK
jgi:hypothetical protein